MHSTKIFLHKTETFQKHTAYFRYRDQNASKKQTAVVLV